jgi:FixJ family two-component response regulator
MNNVAALIDEPSSQLAWSATPVVFVVDADASARESLERQIHRAGWRPETFGLAHEFLARSPVAVPSCLVLDVSLPDINGLELQRLIATDWINTPVIFATGHGDVPMTVQAMKAGAVEFLTKPLSDEKLLDAIRYALERSRASLRQEAQTQVLRDRYASLTPREREVLASIVRGRLNKQVGAELGISDITVKAHRGKMMQKMRADSLAALVRMAARLGFTPTSKT